MAVRSKGTWMERGKRALSRSLSTLSSALLNIAPGSGLMLLFDGSLPSDADGRVQALVFLAYEKLNVSPCYISFLFIIIICFVLRINKESI